MLKKRKWFWRKQGSIVAVSWEQRHVKYLWIFANNWKISQNSPLSYGMTHVNHWTFHSFQKLRWVIYPAHYCVTEQGMEKALYYVKSLNLGFVISLCSQLLFTNKDKARTPSYTYYTEFLCDTFLLFLFGYLFHFRFWLFLIFIFLLSPCTHHPLNA